MAVSSSRAIIDPILSEQTSDTEKEPGCFAQLYYFATSGTTTPQGQTSFILEDENECISRPQKGQLSTA